MKFFCNNLIAMIFTAFLAMPAWSAELAGLWQEYNDDTGNPEAWILIEKVADNSYEGRIQKILLPAAETLVCTKCGGALRNRPLVGLRILTGLKRHSDLTFEDGEITDPDDGNTYRCNVRLSEDGKTLEVTGYLSYNWIGHSEIWRRVK